MPELTDAFLNKLAGQADAQAKTSQFTEQARDDCLVALLQGLRSQRHGAGETVASWEQRLRDNALQLAAGDSNPLLSPTLQMPSD
ncbi:hypothetical protein [Bradyrhizobium sp. WSM1417]|uniref:hypothetical protein n=1 Tax=Bradyrhizobium sp. WSM1417 TaxID=754500 RepID=UPI000484459A|nr:hypothetical protein [Bradyrhizobium sp. WSM1417]